jgi:hypothetical protein
MQGRFIGLFAAVSGLAALAVALLSQGIAEHQAGPLAAGLAAAVLTLLGLAVLARFVIVSERESRRR